MANSVRPLFGSPGSALTLSKTGVTGTAIVAGMLLEYRTGLDKVGPAGAASIKCCGVAQDDIPIARSYIGGPQLGDGHEVVVHRNCVIQVTASGSVAAGDKLKCGAAGVAVTWVSGTDDAGKIVGEALEAAADGATFRALIY